MHFSAFPQREQTMRRRLVGYMLALIAVVLAAMLAGLSLMGQFHSDQRELKETLALQMNFWEKSLLDDSDALAAMGLALSQSISEETETRLDRLGISFDALDQDALADLQKSLLPLLRDHLLQADASGAYLLLDATADPGAGTRCGLYLQRKTLSPSDDSLLLYRGKASAGKNYGIMPHRKWRLELEFFCDSEPACETFPEEWSYGYTPIFTLPGTSEQAMLLQVPIRGPEGDFRGICGFEVSQTYFKQNSQPALYPHLSFLLTAREDEATLASDKLAAGTTSNYFFRPAGPLTIRDTADGLQQFRCDGHAFIGLHRPLSLSPAGEPYTIAVILPQEEYRHLVLESLLQSLLLLAVVLIFAVICCVFFSRTYLLPILRGLEEMKENRRTRDSGVREIDDLFRFLLSQDQAHEDALRTLEDEKNRAQSRAALIQQEYDRIRQEAAPSGQLEIRIDRNSPEYEAFCRGLSELTVTERKIVQYYFEGKTVKEIQVLMDIKETTLRYHNRNIYGKLGVHSMKQLLRFAVCAGDQRTG